MSRNSRQKRPPRKGNPVSRPGAGQPERVGRQLDALRLRRADDGYSNAAAFLGEASPLLSSGTFLRSGLTADTELLTILYRDSWLAKRIIDMPSEDMTRAWYRLSGVPDSLDLNLLRRLEAKHSLRQELANAIRWARLYGGALALIVLRGEENCLDLPLNPDLLLPDCFQGLLVLDRAQGITPSAELETDLDDPDFGLPKYYSVDLDMETPRTVKIHHSRVLRFIGRELPRLESIRENYWGASEIEHLWDELQKRSATSANIAQLVFQANITSLKISDFGDTLAMGTDEQKMNIRRAMADENRFRTSYGIQLLSQDDDLENHPYSFSGLAEIYDRFMMDMAGAAEIPATRLFGRSPQGMNATGESDLRNYYELIAQMQERTLRPALDKLLPILAVSCWGVIPDEMEFHFEPLVIPSQAERADLAARLSAPVVDAFRAGLLTRAEALAELRARGEPLGFFRSI